MGGISKSMRLVICREGVAVVFVRSGEGFFPLGVFCGNLRDSVKSSRLVVLPDSCMDIGRGARVGEGSTFPVKRGVRQPALDILSGLLPSLAKVVMSGMAEKVLKVLIMESSTPAGSSRSIAVCGTMLTVPVAMSSSSTSL